MGDVSRFGGVVPLACDLPRGVWAPALAQCPITDATLAICGYRLRRGACLIALYGSLSASGSAASSFFTRERSDRPAFHRGRLGPPALSGFREPQG